MSAQPLEILRKYMRPDGTLRLDRAATQALWDECQKAEDENTRTAPTVDDSAIEEALRLALADAGRRFAAIGKHGCANDSIAKAELTRLAARCKAIAGSGTTMKDQHDDIDQADYDDMAAHDDHQQPPAAPVDDAINAPPVRVGRPAPQVKDEPQNVDGPQTVKSRCPKCDGILESRPVKYGAKTLMACPHCSTLLEVAITPAQHQHEIAPADSGVCADGLTADGKIPNTTKKEDE